MSKTIAGVVVTIIAIILIGGAVLVVNQSDGDPTTSDHSMHEGETKQSNLNVPSDICCQAQSGSDAVQTTTIDIKDFAYAPAKVQVKKGAAVTWTNQDNDRHDVNPDRDSENFKASGLLGKGESYTFTFNQTGTYTYHCSPHPYMKGTVEVVE